jgi:hypothetical protein
LWKEWRPPPSGREWRALAVVEAVEAARRQGGSEWRPPAFGEGVEATREGVEVVGEGVEVAVLGRRRGASRGRRRGGSGGRRFWATAGEGGSDKRRGGVRRQI